MTALTHTHTHMQRISVFPPPTPAHSCCPLQRRRPSAFNFQYLSVLFMEGHSAAPEASPTVASSTFLKWLQITLVPPWRPEGASEEQHEVAAIALYNLRWVFQKRKMMMVVKNSAGDKTERKTHALKLLNYVIAALMPQTHKINTLQSNQNALSGVQSAPRADVS